MQNLSWYWRRVCSMDAPEIAWRVKSLVRDQIDSLRIPLGIFPRLKHDQLIPFADFEPGFTCSPLSNSDWQEPLSAAKQRWLSKLIKKADDILDNRLSYFDLESVHHGDPVNWHRDFSAGIDAPVILSVRTDYRNFKKFGDCKLVWEQNRHHQLVVLGRAYIATDERRYAEKVAELMRSWIDANPFGYGMNWKSPLELGVRLINWVWAIDLIRSAGVFDTELWNDVLQNAHWAMWDCERKFSQGSSANNHLIGEAAGVFVATSYFRDLPNADSWRQSSRDVLEREIIAQTFADGCTREHAFGYQFFVMQFFLAGKRAGDGTGEPFSREFSNRLLQMYRFMDEISADTGRPPNMGDADDGYVLDLGDLPRNAGELLSVGRYEYDGAGLTSSGCSETVFWLFGDVRQRTDSNPGPRASKFFADSGYAVLRSDRMSVFFDCASLGFGPIAAHGHADCLSFCLSVNGRPIFVDPGTYDYFSHPEWREYFRQTRAHNTVEIGGMSQSVSLGPFLWGTRAVPSAVRWSDTAHAVTISAEHDGYTRLSDRTIHRRTVNLDHTSERISITDEFSCLNSNDGAMFFHCHPDCIIEPFSDTETRIRRGELTISLRTFGKQRVITATEGDAMAGWTSDQYHQKSNSSSIEMRFAFSDGSKYKSEITVA